MTIGIYLKQTAKLPDRPGPPHEQAILQGAIRILDEYGGLLIVTATAEHPHLATNQKTLDAFLFEAHPDLKHYAVQTAT